MHGTSSNGFATGAKNLGTVPSCNVPVWCGRVSVLQGTHETPLNTMLQFAIGPVKSQLRTRHTCRTKTKVDMRRVGDRLSEPLATTTPQSKKRLCCQQPCSQSVNRRAEMSGKKATVAPKKLLSMMFIARCNTCTALAACQGPKQWPKKGTMKPARCQDLIGRQPLPSSCSAPQQCPNAGPKAACPAIHTRAA